MLTRSLVLISAAVFTIAGSVAHANVSPALEMQRQSDAQQLQKLIDEVPYRALCSLEKAGASDSIVGIAARSPFNRNIGEDDCMVPAPKPNLNENIAHVI